MTRGAERLLLGGLAGVLLGAAASIGLVLARHATLAGAAGLALGAVVAASIGALCGAIGGSLRGQGARAARAAFGAVIGVAAHVTLRRLGFAEVSLLVFDAGFAPWGQLALLTIPPAGLVAGLACALDDASL